MTIALAVVDYALNAAWEIPLIVLAAWIAARMVRRAGPAAELRVWTVALVMEAVLPACPAALPAAVAWMREAMAAMFYGHANGTGTVSVRFGPASAVAALPLSRAHTAVAAMFLAAITVHFTARLLWSLWRTSRLSRHAVPVESDTATAARLRVMCSRFPMEPPALAVSPEIAGPVVVGHRRSVLLLPAGFAELLSERDLDAALAHELAHVQQHDFAMHVVEQILALPVRFHPLAWHTLARLEAARESARDAMAANMLDGPRTYAHSLLRLAGAIQKYSTPAYLHGPSLFGAGSLERRIMQLTHPTVPLSHRRRVLAVCAALLLCGGVCGSALALRVGVTAPAPRSVRNGGQDGGPMHVSGGVMAGQVLTKVAPVYPAEAKSAGVQGSVVLSAIIGEDGAIKDLTVVSGPEPLQAPSLEAVRRWTYKPYLLNGNPVPVKTLITVTYSLAK